MKTCEWLLVQLGLVFVNINPLFWKSS